MRILQISLLVVPFLAACASKGPWNVAPVGYISAESVRESSGLVASRKFDDILWTHNDANNPGQIFAIDRVGNLRATFDLACADNHDWEDIAISPDGRLFLLDNTSRMDPEHRNTIYTFEEPEVLSDGTIDACSSFTVAFPDGGFDCESLMYWRESLYFVTKPWDGTRPRAYRYDALGEDGVATLIGHVPIYAMITGGDISEDGRRIALSSYRALLVQEGPGGPDQLLLRDPIICPLNAGQIEGVCWIEDDIFLSSEQREIFRISSSDWRKSQAPFLKTPKIDVPYTFRPPNIEVPFSRWTSGSWLRSSRSSTRTLGRVVWSKEGLHIGIELPERLALGPGVPPDSFSEWFRPGSVYLMINPNGIRPISYGEGDRTILLGQSPDGSLIPVAISLRPATLINSSEVMPSWIEASQRANRLLITLKPLDEGIKTMIEDREIGFNLIVIEQDGELLSWAPLIQRFSWDSPSLWGLLELED